MLILSVILSNATLSPESLVPGVMLEQQARATDEALQLVARELLQISDPTEGVSLRHSS